MKPAAYGPFPYSPIIRRPKLSWPDGAQVALWVIPNIEFFSLTEKVPAGAGGSGAPVPDVPAWSARDYGNRVGVFRLMQVLDRYGIRATVALNSELCGHHPEIIEKATGTRPKGWLGSGLQETWNTLDLLAAAGCDYVSDWTNDDQPYMMTLEAGKRLVAMPYSHEINDKPAFEKFHRTADEFKDMICRQFDVLYREGAESGRVMAIALHPYLTGVPHRIDALDAALAYICRHPHIWKATGSEIARHYRAQI